MDQRGQETVRFQVETGFNPAGVREFRDQVNAATRDVNLLIDRLERAARAANALNLGTRGTAVPSTSRAGGTRTAAGGGIAPSFTDAGAMNAYSAAARTQAQAITQVGNAAATAAPKIQKVAQAQQGLIHSTFGAASAYEDFKTAMRTTALYGAAATAIGLPVIALQQLIEKTDEAVDAAARMDRYRQSFRGILGEETGQRALISNIRFAAKTPFDLEETIQLFQQFTSAGVKLNDVIPTLQAAGNEVARLGRSSDSLGLVVLALTQITSKEVLMGQEIRQLQEQGINAVTVISEVTGKTRGEVEEMIELQAVSGKEFLAMFRQWSAGHGDFLARMAADYLGVQQNLEDVTFLLEAAFGEASMRERTEATKRLVDTLSSPQAEMAARKLGEMWGGIQGKFTETQQFLAQGIITVTFLWDKLINNFQGDLFEWAMQEEGLGKSMGSTTDAVEERTEAIAKQIAQLEASNAAVKERVNLEEDLLDLETARAEYERDLVLSLDVLTPSGQAAGLRNPRNLANVTRAATNYETRRAEVEAEQAISRLKAIDPAAGLGVPFGMVPDQIQQALMGAGAGRGPGYGPSENWATAIDPWRNLGNLIRFLPSAPQAIGELQSNLIRMIHGSAPGRALGGPLDPNGIYTVGEPGAGPEILMMGASARGMAVPTGHNHSSGGIFPGYCLGCGRRLLGDMLENDPYITRAVDRGQGKTR